MINEIIIRDQTSDSVNSGGTRTTHLAKTMFNSPMEDSSSEEEEQMDTSSDVEEETETAEGQS